MITLIVIIVMIPFVIMLCKWLKKEIANDTKACCKNDEAFIQEPLVKKTRKKKVKN